MLLLSAVPPVEFSSSAQLSASEPLSPSAADISRSFTVPLTTFSNDVTADQLTQKLVWHINGLTEVTDSRGHSFTFALPISGGTFNLLQNTSTVDQKFIGKDIQYDIFWKPLRNSQGVTEKYKFTIAGTAVNQSMIVFNLNQSQSNERFGQVVLSTGLNPTNNAASVIPSMPLNAALNWTAPTSTGNGALQSIPLEPQELPEGIGIDWSDAVNSGYAINFGTGSSTVEIPVRGSFLIDPTTVDSTSAYLSPTTTTSYEGERRVVYINGTVFAFYRDGAEDGTDGIAYRYSTDHGNTWSSKVQVGTGSITGDAYRWTIATTTYNSSPQIAIMYWKAAGSNMEFYSNRGTVSGTSITWSGSQLIGYTAANSSVCGSGSACGAVVAATDTNGYIYAAFRWISGGATTYSYRILRSLDGGYSWTFLFSQVDGVSQNRPAMALTRLGSGEMLFAYALYESSDLYYRVLNVSAGTWALNTWSGIMSANSIKQISADSDPANYPFLVYTLSNGTLKAARWETTGLPVDITTVDSTLVHSLPSISMTPEGAINIFSIASGKVYETRSVGRGMLWRSPTNPFGTTFTAVDQLTSAIARPSALWTENSAFPRNIRFGEDPLDPTGSTYRTDYERHPGHEGVGGIEGFIRVYSPTLPSSCGNLRICIYEALIEENGGSGIGAGWAKLKDAQGNPVVWLTFYYSNAAQKYTYYTLMGDSALNPNPSVDYWFRVAKFGYGSTGEDWTRDVYNVDSSGHVTTPVPNASDDVTISGFTNGHPRVSAWTRDNTAQLGVGDTAYFWGLYGRDLNQASPQWNDWFGLSGKYCHDDSPYFTYLDTTNLQARMVPPNPSNLSTSCTGTLDGFTVALPG